MASSTPRSFRRASRSTPRAPGRPSRQGPGRGRHGTKRRRRNAAAPKFSRSTSALAERRARSPRNIRRRRRGDGEGGESRSRQEFAFPYLAHAAMEPMNAVVKFADGAVRSGPARRCRRSIRRSPAKIFGVPPDKVQIDTKYAGGSFGRRAVPDSDYVAEAATAAKAWGKPDPVKLVWRREDDMRAGYYRPTYLHRVKVGLDADGNIVAWRHIDRRPVDPRRHAVRKGAGEERHRRHLGRGRERSCPTRSPTSTSSCTRRQVGVPVLWWRSVGHTHTAYVVETMMDQLAAEAGTRSRRHSVSPLLKDKPRHVGVLKLAAEKAGWTSAAAGGDVPRRRGARELPHFRRACRGGVDVDKARPRSNASSARSIAASPSIPTSSKRRWRAASASASARRCATRSR